jgi:hypothetical protein
LKEDATEAFDYVIDDGAELDIPELAGIQTEVMVIDEAAAPM